MTRWLLAAVLLSAAHLCHAGEPDFDPKSSITITFREMGLSIDAPFTKFWANIDFDEAHPEQGSVRFAVDIASIDMGNVEYSKMVQAPEWFDGAGFPVATFVSTSLRRVTPRLLEATGQLTIKGHTDTVTFPVSVRERGSERAYDGSLHISRLAYGVGTGEWLETSVVGDDVTIAVHAVTRRAAGDEELAAPP